MHKKAKHSKFKNAGILFELLTRQITADILAGRDESFTKNLMFKYFHESKELGKEVQLYNFILQQKSKDVSSAERLLGVVLQTRSKLDERELNKQKYSIIKEIKEKYNIDDFLKNKIPNYKLYASIYKLFEDQDKSEVKFEVTELIESREYIVENLTKEKKSDQESMDVYGSQTADVRLLAYKFLIENFNSKYNDLLPDQKKLLKEYITNVSNSSKFTKYVNEEYKRISVVLKEQVKNVTSEVVKIKINEVISQFSTKSCAGIIKENQLTSLLNAYELVEEIKKIDVKNETKS
tara:strand:- start:639 stop:1517 length:879 start_codon:yes stop_codon:yes gene_type:complete